MAKMVEACVICGSDDYHEPRECVGKMIHQGIKAEFRNIVALLKKEFPVKMMFVLGHPSYSKILKKIVGEE